MPVISPPATVLVTGANGYIGLWVVHELLRRGYTVHGVVRSPSKSQSLTESLVRQYPDAANRYKGVVVPDITVPGAFDEALKGVDAIIHTASPLPNESIADPKEYIEPAVKGTLSILESALKSNIKRVVITSSVVAVSSRDDPPRVYTEDDWNSSAVKTVEERGEHADILTKYDASKTLAEQAVWKFVEDHKSEIRFEVTTVLPAFVFGPVADETLPSPAALPGTPSHFYQQLFQAPLPAERTPKYLNFVDVRDVTDLHIRSLEVEGAAGQRIIASSQATTWDDWLLAGQQLNLLPGLPKPGPNAETGEHKTIIYSNEKAKRIFGIKLRTVPETLKDVIEDHKKRGWLKHLEA
ncbi:D-lactaldehyde dehydrogenase [Trametes elegans]|nr:D-lactaldehyde dehydrogenase [Trametes elegans]